MGIGAAFSVGERRRALGLAQRNAALWAAGNGLTSGAAISYLAQELGARGLGVSLILAVPAFVGLLRLLTPALIARCGSSKAACLAASLAAYLLLLPVPFVPWAAAGGWVARPLALLIGLICLHQLLESIGQVALFAWLGELAPRRIRGRFFARRQVWQLAAMIPLLLAAGFGIDRWKTAHPDEAWRGYAVVTAVGAILLLASLVPLCRMPGVRWRPPPGAANPTPSFVVPRDPRFARLLLFGCWFSFFNGLTQAAQNIYPYAVLGLGLLPLLVMQTAMRCGQLVLSPPLGRLSDRYGNRPVLIASQAVVAAAPLFFLLATPAHAWVLTGAWLLWSAYAGLNVCLPSLILKLSPGGESAKCVAWYWGITSVFYAGSTLLGGMLHDLWRDYPGAFRVGPLSLDAFQYQFLLSLATRGLGVLLLVRLIEPGAWRWLEILRGKKPARDDTRAD